MFKVFRKQLKITYYTKNQEDKNLNKKRQSNDTKY